MKDLSAECHNIHDLREIARKRLPKGLFEFVDRGTEDEVALRNNREAFERIKLSMRNLVDVAGRTQEVTLFGVRHKMPIAIAPTGCAGLMWHEGELELAKAAAAAGIPFSLATGALTSMEKITEVAGGTLWFQLYMWPDRSLSHKLVQRAEAAGYKALLVTVDGVVSPNREYNLRNGFTIPFSFTRRNVVDVMSHPGWLMGVLAKYMMTTGMPRYENYPTELKAKMTAQPMGKSMMKNDSLNWDDLRALRKLWPHTLILKGVMHPQDAIMAAECGADGVIVSNHGGRNFDSALAPIEVLPHVAEAVGKRVTVLVDSGFRRGSDVVKALALGEKAVLVGRPTLYGTTVGGEAGAARAIKIFRDEIDRTIAYLGYRSLEEITRDCLILPEHMRTVGGGKNTLSVVEGAKAAAGA
jgi:isopentenyl diphosphate isomerase/L-lactate dehydrogenase-like FMN-dependent dehydrogenase